MIIFFSFFVSTFSRLRQTNVLTVFISKKVVSLDDYDFDDDDDKKNSNGINKNLMI